MCLACASLSVLPQCSPEGQPSHQKIKVPAQSPKPVAVAVEIRDDGLAYAPGADTPFTGEAVDLHDDPAATSPLRRTPYVDGKKHGAMTRWSPKGKLMDERHYDHGKPLHLIGYHSNGQKKIELTLNANDKGEGPHRRWHDNGVIQVESAFDAEERFHGEEKGYNREGTLISHYRNEHGVLAEIIFETPEAKEARLKHWKMLEEAGVKTPESK